MNFGPMEFAAHLERKDAERKTAGPGAKARAAAPAAAPAAPKNQLTIISGPGTLSALARSAQVEAISVYEPVDARAAASPAGPGVVRVSIRRTTRPVVLVLSSHQSVEWQLDVAPDAELEAVLLAGYGESTVAGAGDALVTSIGGFYAFKRGSAEFRHLEDEVLRCTGRNIENFQSVYSGGRFEIGGEKGTDLFSEDGK
jgi:hypothetical protein